MANIGSEVHRAIDWYRKRNNIRFIEAFEKAFELFDLTLSDDRWKGRRKEISRSKEIFGELLTKPDLIKDLDKELDWLDNYFFQYGLMVSLRKGR